jgi:hypothetical protein
MLEQPVHVKMLIGGKWTGGPNILVAVFSAAGHWIFNQVINMIECNLIDWFLDLERPRPCYRFRLSNSGRQKLSQPGTSASSGQVWSSGYVASMPTADEVR